MKMKLKQRAQIISRVFKKQCHRSTALLLTLCMVLAMLPITRLSASASTTDGLIIDSSVGVDGKALISVNVSTKDLYYAVLGKSGAVTPAATTGTGASVNGWYQATSTGAISFSGIDPAQSPFQIVTSATATSSPGGTAAAVSVGTKFGNCIYYYYVANGNTTDAYTVAGNDTYGNGTKEKPYLTVSETVKKLGNIEDQIQGVIVLLDDTEFTSLLQIPDVGQNPQITTSKNVTITSNGDRHSILRNLTGNSTIELCNKSKLTLDNVAVNGNRQANTYGEVFLDSNTTFLMRGNSKIIHGANRGVEIRSGATFIMESGEISGNAAGTNPTHWSDGYIPTSCAGGGVYICAQPGMKGGTFIMKGGKITGNTATVGAAGIFGEFGSTIQISGDSNITGNTKTGTPSNIYLNNNQTITLTGALSDTANLGVYVTNMPGEGQPDVTIATGDGAYVPTSSDERAFSSDQATTAGVTLSNSQIVMSNEAKAHDVTVSGTVSDYAGGKNDLSGILVSLYDAADTNFARTLGTATTNAGGTYTMSTAVKNGSYAVRIGEKAGYYGSCFAPVTVASTTVSGADLTLTKYTKSFVQLNQPVFNNDKSGYSFKSATISNFTGVNSITFSITKGTTVQSVPSFLTPSSKLESIDGDTRTFTYEFANNVTVSQAEEFIRGIVFNYVAGADISITVDNNVTKLPDGATITKFTPPDDTAHNHYYMFVPFGNNAALSWSAAYNAAKTYRYMGMIGYLATITSQDEDTILDNISMSGGWSGGSRNTGAYDGATAPSGTPDNYFKWCCGPEKGENYYYYHSPSDKHVENGEYNGFKDANEPNNYYQGAGYSTDIINSEWCMQIHHKGANNVFTWNDLSNESTTQYVTGYFVEFSSYQGGMDGTYASDKTAVGTYNLTTDGGVEDAATVALNAPVYGSDKSEFSFNNAEIKNISTIYSLTIKLDNYTNILSKPSAPVVTNELSNIAGATNTITYQFESGITLADAQSFLRGLKFRYGGLKTSSTTNVSVTVDGNKTNLPKGANITEFNGHYYMYVPSDFISWTDAYNKAKSYTYMGYKGYLATITSEEEDKVLTNISTISAWSAGTCYLNNDSSKLTDPDYVSALSKKGNFYYWACGPEAGTIYYNSTSPTATPGAGYTGYNGAYNNWGANPGQPDSYTTGESCMQVNWPYDTGANGKMRWNDLPNAGLPSLSLVKGYFVEFSDYDGGRVDGFTQSANGKSVVPISVEKGDVFSTVKDGGTYYVDTVLKAFDRNITKITVNSNNFTSGSKLPGNINTSYTIVATDLEGNTATMTVTMKTIASISQPISGLTVNNVQMSNKDSILAVKAALKAIDTTDASATQITVINNAIQNCNNLYFALFSAAPTTVNGTNGWYKNGIGDITLTAPSGFVISTSAAGTWTSSITVDNADGANKSVVYYLKETATGDISSAKTFNYKVDTVAPTGTITIKSNTFKSFLNTISFGLFYKNSVDVSVSGTDTTSAPVSISYQKVKAGESYSENGTWVNGSSFSVTSNEKFSVYAKLTDTAGNLAIINSQGVVVYTDSTQGTANISFTKTGTTDVTAAVNLNGNTVKDIRNGTGVIDPANYTVASDGTITLKAGYLDSLAVGSYALTVSYNPMGESYAAGVNNEAPATTALTLNIKAKDMTGTGGVSAATVSIDPDSMVYSGSAFVPAVTVKDGATTLVKDTDYTLSWPSDMTTVGDKTLTITFKGNYTGVVTKTATITNASVTDKTVKTQSATYNGSKQTVTAPAGTTVNSQVLAVRYSADNGSTYNLTSAPQFTSVGTYTVYYQLSAPNHNSVTGQIAFTINAATDNAVSNLTLNGWVFGSAANTPTATAKYGTTKYTYSDSANGIYTSTVPTAAGTYFVKASVDAAADYNGCEAKTSFVISAKAMNSQDIAISGVNDYYLFTGSAITPEPIVTVNNTVLTKDTDYTVAYENNTAISTNAKVKVTLKGNYSGTADRAFEIRYGTIKDDDIKNVITLPDFNSTGWYNKDIVIAAVGDWALCTTPTGTFGKTLTISNESTKTGTDYTFYIKNTNGSVYERTLNYKLDKTAPEGSVSVGKSGLKNILTTITFGLLFNSDADVTVTSSDTLSGVAGVEVYKADKELTKDELAGIQWSDYTSAIHETAKDAEHFIYYARITDNAGNTVVVNSEGVTFDTTAPVISGITNGETYYTTQKFIVTDPNIDTVTVNSKDLASGSFLPGNVNETYTLVATDKAGNRTTVYVTMKPISNLSDHLGSITEDDVKPDDQAKIEDVKKQAEAVETTNATAEEKEALQKIIDRCNRLLGKIEADKNKTESPHTGDTANMSVWASLFLVFGSAMITIGINKKSRKGSAK